MKFKSILLIIIVLSVVLTMSAVSAEDINATDSEIMAEADGEVSLDVLSQNQSVANKNASFSKVSQTTYIKGNSFNVKLLDDGKAPLVNKTVSFTINSNEFNVTTNKNGNAILPLNFSKGTYTIKYKFNESGYNPVESSSKIMIITTKTSKFTASKYTAYVGVSNAFKVVLKVDGIPLSGRKVSFLINGVTYDRLTNSKGEASLAIGLKKGVYPIKFTYVGEKNINKASGSSQITVKKGMPVSMYKANSMTLYHKTLGQFKIKLVDVRGNTIKNKVVKFTINGKTYSKKTNSNGIATLDIKMRSGSYKMTVTSPKTSIYNKVSKTYTIKIISSKTRNNGMWLFGRDMKKVDLDKLKKYGMTQILLNFKALELWGQSEVEKFIANAGKRNIKVHIWMQAFYHESKWQNPVKDGEIDYDLIDSKVNLVKKYASIKGVAGVNIDYVRYPGTAYKYPEGVNAINYFIKTACEEAHAINPKLIISAAVMPEPSSLEHYYGQDIPEMSKYLDVIIPMVYKGNYGKSTSWINTVTSKLVKMSNGAKIWTGIQSFKSDSNPTKLSSSALFKDADAAASGGAYGVILFRYGLFNYINFNKI